MNSSHFFQLFNLSLRGITLVCRLGLLLTMTNVLAPEEVGLYGLLFVAVNYLVMVVGLDFYTFSNRELITASAKDGATFVWNQIALYLIAYAVILPASLSLFRLEVLPWKLVAPFILLIVAEHLCFEAYRILVAIGKPIKASVVIFVRGGSWILIIIPLFKLGFVTPSLTFILNSWVAGATIACFLALVFLRESGLLKGRFVLDTRWIKTGIIVAIPFLLGTLALRAMFTLDRFAIERYSGLDIVGIYTFFIGICSALYSLIEASVISFHYPRLVETAAIDRDFKAKIRLFLVHTTVATLTLCGLIYALAPWLLGYISNSLYIQNLDMLTWLLIAHFGFSLSMVPHYGLYALHRDMDILTANILALLTFIASIWLLYRLSYAQLSIPIALTLAFFVLLFSKSGLLVFRYRQTPQQRSLSPDTANRSTSKS